MTKEEVLNELKASREINEPGDTKLWRVAFDLYLKAKGMKLSLTCSKCFAAVKEWLTEDK